jgi:transcriptional regulator with GAF, ATPase, and Fis domain
MTAKDRGFEVATATLARDAPPAPLGAVLHVTDVASPPAPFKLEIGRCTVGSSPNADLVIAAPTVSRRHLELALVPQGVAVADLGSRNGTYYMGQLVEKMVVALGTQLKLGTATLSIEPDGDSLEQLRYPNNEYRGMTAASPGMKRLFAKLRKLEGSLATVLVEGESGVGKELIANALHHGSVVRDGPMIVINCGAMPGDLVGSALFGHKRGAFTGAVEDRAGAFEAADGGTLFLDEIGEMPLDVQPMLLRALEARQITPVGGTGMQTVNVRVVAATNRNLEEEVAEGRFREDLYYRLAVIKLAVPPLRERREDVPLLARRFADDLGLEALPGEVEASLCERPWPGNVRELRNAIQVYAALGALPETKRSRPATLHLALDDIVDLDRPYADLKEELVDHFTRRYLERLLAHTNGNQTAAARIAGLDRTYIGRLVQKHGLGTK